MNKEQRHRYQLFVRVRDFGTVNVDTFPASSPGGLAFAVVAEATEAIKAHATARRLATREGRRVKAQKRSAVLKQMQEIARTAKGVAREMPGIDRNFRVPERRSDVALVTAARSMLTVADGIAERFVHLGLAPSFLVDLRAADSDRSRSSRRSAPAGWAKSIGRETRGSAVMSPSKCCRTSSPRMAIGSAGSSRKRGRSQPSTVKLMIQAIGERDPRVPFVRPTPQWAVLARMMNLPER